MGTVSDKRYKLYIEIYLQLSGKVFAVLVILFPDNKTSIKTNSPGSFRIFIVLIEVLRFLSFSLFEKRRKIS